MFGKLEYDKEPVGNFTDEVDYFDAYTNFVYPEGTVARIVCREGYGNVIRRREWVDLAPCGKRAECHCIDGAWTKDLDKYSTDFVESIHGFLLCEPDNEDWKESFRDDYFGMEYGDYSTSVDDGVYEEDDAANNSTEPRLKCYQGYKVSPLLLRECKKGAKSCRSEAQPLEERVKLTCSDEPCELNGKLVDTAVCYNTSAEWDESCCCYGDGCNGNTHRGELLAKGISVKSRSACVGFSWISHGTTVYAEKATGTANFDDYYDNEHERPTYPNGTVARLTCDKGYAPYRSTNGGDVYDKYALYICDNGGWVREGEGDDLTTLSIHDSCKKSGWQLAEPPKQTEDE
ncbi:hypothetical protein AAVH_37873, partial [Aphelenchoides avenae]